MAESTARKKHEKIRAHQTGRAMEGRSCMSSIPEENWEKIFPKKKPKENDELAE